MKGVTHTTTVYLVFLLSIHVGCHAAVDEDFVSKAEGVLAVAESPVPEPEDRRAALAALSVHLEDWAKVDASGLAAWAVSYRGDRHTRMELIERAGGALAANDPTQALSWAQSIVNGELRYYAINVVVSTWARTAPAEAVAWSLAQPRALRARTLARAVEEWGQRDPEHAAGLVMQIEGEIFRHGVLGSVGGHYANKDPEAALAWAHTLPGQANKEAALRGILPVLGVTNPDRAVQLLREHVRAFKQGHTQFAIARSLIGTDDLRAINLARSAPETEWGLSPDKEIVVSALRSIARMDPSNLEELVAKHDDQLVRDLGIRILIESTEDLEEAFSLVQSIGTKAVAEDAFYDVVKRKVGVDPAGTAELLNANEPLVVGYFHLATAWAAIEPHRAARWALDIDPSLEPSYLKKSVISNVVREWCIHDPEQAAAWTLALDEQYDRNRMLMLVAAMWCYQDADAAIDWASSLQDDDTRNRSFAKIARILVFQDPRRAVNVMETVSLAGVRNDVLPDFITELAEVDPQSALTLLDSVSDLEQRRKLLNPVIRSWARREPERATAWSMALTDSEDRARALSGLVDYWSDDREYTPQARSILGLIPDEQIRRQTERSMEFRLEFPPMHSEL